MDYVELYYEFTHGVYPFDTDEPRIQTQKTIDYLLDCNLSDKEIFAVLEQAPRKDALTYADLPDTLWENSLLEKDKFYYHNSLQLRSKMPKFNLETCQEEPGEPYYLEMKIKYTLHDLLNYFYMKADIEPGFKDEKKDLGAMAHLLNQYQRIDFIEGVDFMLALIDYAVQDKDCSTSTIFHLDSDYRAEVFDLLKQKTAQAVAYHHNKIVHR